MKNIHILSTHKRSRLYEFGGKLILNNNQTSTFRNQNIFITNSEEIKDGEYGICLNLVREGFESHQVVFKMDSEQRQAMEDLGGQKKAEVLKVILTTDQDLIKDGIQKIDDEFLEWFVKNQNYEEVKTKLVEFEVDMGLGDSCIEYGSYYKIIIPEEPKQEKMYNQIDLEVAFYEGVNGDLSFSEWFENFNKKYNEI